MTRVSVYVLCNGEGPFSGWCIIIGSGGEEVFDFGDKLAGTKLRDMERRLRALTEEAGEARCEFRVGGVAIVGVVDTILFLAITVRVVNWYNLEQRGLFARCGRVSRNLLLTGQLYYLYVCFFL